MLQCQSEIYIRKQNGTQIFIPYVNSISIESGYEMQTDNCDIVFPRNTTYNGKKLFNGTDSIFKRGDYIEVAIGYVPNLTTVFKGYIVKIGGNVVVELHCEDAMFKLKQIKCTFPTKKSTGKNISDFLKEVMPSDIKYNVTADNSINNQRFTDLPISKCLDIIKDATGLKAYFRDGILQVGFANDAKDTKEALFEMEKVVINSQELEWQVEEDVKIGVTLKVMDIETNKTKEFFAGDKDGDQKSFTQTGTSDSDAKEFVEKKAKEFRYTGFVGSLETFGEPILRHGDRCKIKSTKLPERDGAYLIKKVTRNYSVDGGSRQIFELGQKVQ